MVLGDYLAKTFSSLAKVLVLGDYLTKTFSSFDLPVVTISVVIEHNQTDGRTDGRTGPVLGMLSHPKISSNMKTWNKM